MTVREIFLDGNYNCAEAVLLWADERYGLGVAPEDVRRWRPSPRSWWRIGPT